MLSGWMAGLKIKTETTEFVIQTKDYSQYYASEQV